MTTQMIIRIDPHAKDRLNKLARAEGKSSSQIVRDLIDDYIRDRDIGSYIDDLWNRIGQKLKTKKVSPGDIDKIIKATRKKQG